MRYVKELFFFCLVCVFSIPLHSEDWADEIENSKCLFATYLKKLGQQAQLQEPGRKIPEWSLPDKLLPVVPGVSGSMVDLRGWNWMMKDISGYDLLVYASTDSFAEFPDKEVPFVLFLRGNQLTLIEGANGLSNPKYIEESISYLEYVKQSFSTSPENLNRKDYPSDLKSAYDGLVKMQQFLEKSDSFPTKSVTHAIPSDLALQLNKLWSQFGKMVQEPVLPEMEELKKINFDDRPSFEWKDFYGRTIPNTMENDKFLIKIKPIIDRFYINFGRYDVKVNDVPWFLELGYKGKMSARCLREGYYPEESFPQKLNELIRLLHYYCSDEYGFKDGIPPKEKLNLEKNIMKLNFMIEKSTSN